MPLTTKIKGYLFEVIIKGEKDSVALVHYAKSLNWQAGNVTYQGSICRTIEEAKEKIGLFFGNMMKNF